MIACSSSFLFLCFYYTIQQLISNCVLAYIVVTTPSQGVRVVKKYILASYILQKRCLHFSKRCIIYYSKIFYELIVYLNIFLNSPPWLIVVDKTGIILAPRDLFCTVDIILVCIDWFFCTVALVYLLKMLTAFDWYFSH